MRVGAGRLLPDVCAGLAAGGASVAGVASVVREWRYVAAPGIDAVSAYKNVGIPRSSNTAKVLPLGSTAQW